MPTLIDPGCRERVLTRLRGISPSTPPQWGVMTPNQMVAHLCDSLRQMLGELEVPSRPTWLRWPLVRQLVMYWLPWPKARIQGPRELFQTPPTTWNADLATFEALLTRFATSPARNSWPEHPFFGPMTHAAWGRFAYRHFDHHLHQFGA